MPAGPKRTVLLGYLAGLAAAIDLEDQGGAEAKAERFFGSPLWRRSRAVRDDRAFEADPSHRSGSASKARAADLALEDLGKHPFE